MGTAVQSRHLPADDDDTRMQVLGLLLQKPRLTAPEIAIELGLTGTAVRRHLNCLAADGYATADHSVRAAGRGRPAAQWGITPRGRGLFGHSYDDLARDALTALRDVGGDKAVIEFARARARSVLADVIPLADQHGDDVAETVAQVAQAFTEHGYAATVEHAGDGIQLCQHHCPVSHVAGQFPELCEAEAEIIGHLVGRPVQPLATIPAGNGVCTTNIPPPTVTMSPPTNKNESHIPSD